MLLTLALSMPIDAQLRTAEMGELREGLTRLRQACLDSLHTSLAYLPEIRQTIETAQISAAEKSRLKLAH